MPRTVPKASADLAIGLDQWQAFGPGNIINGSVIRSAALHDEEATVVLKLRGRAAADMNVKGGTFKYTYNNEFDFFGNSTTWTIFKGPIEITSDTPNTAWPFQVKFPVTLSEASVAANKTPAGSFLSLAEDDIKKQELPDVFSCAGNPLQGNLIFHGYVEYYLEAELIPSKGPRSVAMQPLLVRRPSKELLQSWQDFGFRKTLKGLSYPSVRLPGGEEKKSGLFRRSKKSTDLKFKVQMLRPSRLQFGNRLPFALRILPDDGASKDLCKAGLQFQVLSFNLFLTAKSEVLCVSGTRPIKEDNNFHFSFAENSLIPEGYGPIDIPVGEDAQPLDIGEKLQLVLDDRGISALGRRVGPGLPFPMMPSLETYCIKHKYMLGWELKIGIPQISKTDKFTGDIDVEMLNPNQVHLDQGTAQLGGADPQAEYISWSNGMDMAGVAMIRGARNIAAVGYLIGAALSF